MAEMSEVQERISTWAERTFNHSERSIALHLVREAVELAMAAGWDNQDIRASVSSSLQKERDVLKRVDEETADVTILALAMAGYLGFDLETVVEAKHAVNIVRKWGQPDGQGITEHVDETVLP